MPFDASILSLGRYTTEIVDVSWEVDGFSSSGNNSCIIIGDGTMTAANVFATFFDVRPSLIGPTAEPGSTYRSFVAALNLEAPGKPVLEDCSQTGTTMLPFRTSFLGSNRDLEFGTLEISADGLSINESWEIGSTTYQLDLLGFPDP